MTAVEKPDLAFDRAARAADQRRVAARVEPDAMHKSPHASMDAAGSWEWDVAADRLTGDARFATLCGLDPVAAAGGLPTEAFFLAVDPQDAMRVRLAIAGALHGVEVLSRDYRVRRRDGTQLWVAARGRTYFDDAGQT